MSDRLGEMIEVQYNQQSLLFDYHALPETERTAIGMELAHGVIEEAQEWLLHSGYKTLLPDRSRATDRREARLFQVADMLKYVLALAHLDGFTPNEIYDAFMDKSDAVEARTQETMRHTKIAGFDLDGVIADIEGAGFSHDLSEAAKDHFFDSGLDIGAQPYYATLAWMESLKSDGWGIVIITTRKRHKHFRLEANTRRWLHQHGVPYDRLIFTPDKADAILASKLPLRFFVEDRAKHALDIASVGVRVFYVGSDVVGHPNILPCETIEAAVAAFEMGVHHVLRV